MCGCVCVCVCVSMFCLSCCFALCCLTRLQQTKLCMLPFRRAVARFGESVAAPGAKQKWYQGQRSSQHDGHRKRCLSLVHNASVKRHPCLHVSNTQSLVKSYKNSIVRQVSACVALTTVFVIFRRCKLFGHASDMTVCENCA